MLSVVSSGGHWLDLEGFVHGSDVEGKALSSLQALALKLFGVL